MTAVEVGLLVERVHRLEGALVELAEELHGISSAQQIAARGKPRLASLVEDSRSGVLGALEDTTARIPLETR